MLNSTENDIGMNKKNVLFIVATGMQIITTLNLITTYKYKADIICLENHLPKAKKYYHNLSSLGIFGFVRLLSSDKVEELFLQKYEEIFVTNDVFLHNYQHQIKSANIKVSIFDEGSMNYLQWFIESCHTICDCQVVYLYEPHLANFYRDKRFIIKQIPKIEAHNHILLQQLNHVFDVDPNEVVVSKDEVLHVFFSQPLQYQLSRKAKIRKSLKLFRSRSNREYALETVGNMQDLIVNHIRHMGVPLYRKFHPREKERSVDIHPLEVELYVLNHPDTKVVQYSLFSSVLTSSFVLGDSYDIKNYFLYHIVVKAIEKYGNVDIINKEVLEFFDKLVKLGKVIPIDSMEELERVCQHEV